MKNIRGIVLLYITSLALLISAFVLNMTPVAHAQTTIIQRWSDPATWGGNLPASGAAVTIPAGRTVLLDVPTLQLQSLQIDGTLIFADQNIELSANWIMVHGALYIGREGVPYRNRATITLTGSNTTGDVMGMGMKVLGSMGGGHIEIIGEPRNGWTRLNATASGGAQQITLAEAMPWRVGDSIVIAPSDFDPFEAEVRIISAISGTQVTLDRPLSFQHWGTLQTYNGMTLDARAEVGLLTRNIVIQGSRETSAPTFGGHTMFMTGSLVRIEGVEMRHMGQQGMLGRYPIHFHMMGDANGSYVRNSSIHHTTQRGIVIHRTNNLMIEGNVIYDTVGHQYFLESSNEIGNRFIRNLGILTRSVPAGVRVDPIFTNEENNPADTGQTRWSTFWISNAYNRFVGNAAVGVENGFGFWIIPMAADGVRDADLEDDPYRAMPLLEFRNNVAHTITNNPDLNFNKRYPPHQAGSCINFEGMITTDEALAQFGQNAPVTGITAYKCSNVALWLSDESLQIDGCMLADARAGIRFPDAPPLTVSNCTIVGQSANQPVGRTNIRPMFADTFGGPDALDTDPASPVIPASWEQRNVRAVSFPPPLPPEPEEDGHVQTGQVNLEGVNLATIPTRPTLELRLYQSGRLVYTFTNVGLDVQGQFTLSDVEPSVYIVWVKTPQHLAQVSSITVYGGAPVYNLGTLTAGDVNNDNTISLADFSLLAASFNLVVGQTGYDARSDLNGDGSVNLIDFSLLSANFNRFGATVPGGY
jgi:hypothetical protein